MKVLIVHHQMALYGGAELVVVRLANYLQEHGHKVSILTASMSSQPEYKGLEFIVPRKETVWHLWDGLHSLPEIGRVFLALRQLCAKYVEGFDVVNVHNFPAIWAVPSNKPIVWMCNEVPDLWHNEHMPRTVNHVLNAGRVVDRLIVRSKYPTAIVPDSECSLRFQRRYGFEPHVIPYGIDGDFFSQLTEVAEPAKFTIIQPSMISPSKCQLETLAAAKALDARVLFVGYCETQNPYTQELMQRSVGLDVHFYDHVTKEKLRALYSTAHVAVFPGKGQGSWLGPFEALAAGTPIVVSPNLSCSATITTHELGMVSHDLTKALTLVYTNYLHHARRAQRASQWVRDNLTWNNFGAKMEELMLR